MEYNWNINSLIKDKKIIEEKYKQETDLSKKYKLLMYLNDINTHIKIRKERVAKDMESFNFSVHYKEYFFNERYYDLISHYYLLNNKKLKQQNLSLKTIEKSFITYLSGDLKRYSNDECFEIAKELYGDTNNSIYKNFLKIYKNRKQIFKTSDTLFDNRGIAGYCIFVPEINNPYIEIYNMDGISKVNTTIHELAHSIMNLKFPERTSNSKDYFGNEIESLFFEMVFQNGLGQQIDKMESEFLSAEDIYSTHITASEVYFHQKIMQNIKYNKIDINKEFYKVIREKLKLTKRETNIIINRNINDQGQYVIGHIIALELYKIYKQDKKEALQLLDKILKNYELDTLQNISQYMNIYDNLNKNLTEECKKMNNQFIKKIKQR